MALPSLETSNALVANNKTNKQSDKENNFAIAISDLSRCKTL